jgi:hypothetical protein
MMPSQKIEDVIRSVKLTTSAATDERITAAGEAAMAKRNEQHPASVHTGAAIRRIIMNSKWTKLATAAAIIIAVMLGMYALTGSVDVASITMAQVRQAMEGIDWMQIINKGGDENITRGGPEIDWFSFASKTHIGIGLRDGIVSYDDFKTRRQLYWPGTGNYIYESPIDETTEFAYGFTGPFDMIDRTFRIIQAEHNSEIVKELGTYQGQKVEVWTVIRDVKSGGSRTLTVYIDLDRKLPIAATYDHTQPDGTVLRESEIEFKYPETGPADIYEAGAPKSAQIKLSPEG